MRFLFFFPLPYLRPQVPIVIPIFVLVMSVVLFMTPILSNPKPQFLVALVFILSAFLIYIPFVYQKTRFPIVGTYTKRLDVVLKKTYRCLIADGVPQTISPSSCRW